MYTKVANCNELWEGEKVGIIINGIPVLITHTAKGIFAFNDLCPHAGAFLSEGLFVENTIVCARHGWEFDASSGKGINPNNVALCSYPVKIDDHGDIWVEVKECKNEKT